MKSEKDQISFRNILDLYKKNNLINDYYDYMWGFKNKVFTSQHGKILSLSVLFLKSNSDLLYQYGYHLLLKYVLSFDDYLPMYELSIQKSIAPILNIIHRNNLISVSAVDHEMIDIFLEKTVLKNLEKESRYYLPEQLEMKEDFSTSKTDYAVIAPTSFGKTELIYDYILKNYKLENIVIIVPTKALINQVKRDLIEKLSNENERIRIITHHDMQVLEDRKNIFVMTQERLSLLLFEKKYSKIFNTVFVDEAHNIFENEQRSLLLSKIITYLKYINPLNTKIYYFSPVISNFQNLSLKYVENNMDGKINKPLLKIENFFLVDIKAKKIELYDQFLNLFHENLICANNQYDFIISESLNKNVIYVNKPIEVKSLIIEFCNYLEEICDHTISNIVKSLADYVHRDYDLIDAVRKGVVYHIGIMPDNIRSYVEDIIKKYDEIKYIFCTSTLLEGVNLPFDRMFIMDTRKGKSNLSFHQLQNLVGRVNRYNNIFDVKVNNLHRLSSSIYIIKNDSKNTNYKDFIVKNLKVDTRSSHRLDDVQNPFLENANKTLSSLEKNTLANIIKSKVDGEYTVLSTNIGELLLAYGVNDFDIFMYEREIESRVSKIEQIDQREIINIIYDSFLKDIEIINIQELDKLKKDEVRNYYQMIYSWKRSNYSLKQMIQKTFVYWKESENNRIYVGKKLGEISKFEEQAGTNNLHKSIDYKWNEKVYINKETKDDKQLINIAIMKTKDDLDFFDHNLLKYIEILHQLKKISEEDYLLFQYGTTNDIQIFLMKDGLSQDLSKLLVEKYSSYITYSDNVYSISDNLRSVFTDENEVLKHELSFYLSKTIK